MKSSDRVNKFINCSNINKLRCGGVGSYNNEKSHKVGVGGYVIKLIG